jgi:hypothetical protein
MFENLPIQIKAFAASAVLLICLIFLGVIAYVTLDKSQEGLRILSSTILPKQQAFSAGEIRRQQIRRNSVLDFLAEPAAHLSAGIAGRDRVYVETRCYS